MRNLWILVLLLVLAACGGGGAAGNACDTCSTGSTILVGTVSGATFDGMIVNGVVTIYDFSSGTKGAQLAQATSDSNGLYSIPLQIETRPILVEITGGYYAEEAGANPVSVTLGANQKLSAVANYTTGATLKVAVTTFTHLAAGLAAFEISKGTAVSTAINDANNRASSLVGANVLTTFPKEITDVANASATLTPELRYGFMEGAISMWTYNNAPNAKSAHLAPYTSIDFAQLLYQDISADGLLDGVGLDSTGAAATLSFGTIPLSVDVYRMGLGTSLVQMAASTNNKTGLTGEQVLPFAQSYIANTDGMFNNVAPSPIIVPVVTITSPVVAANAWIRGLVSVAATTQITPGIGTTVEFLVDNVSVGTAANLAAPTFTLDTSAYSDGAHTIGVRAADLAGQVTTSTVSLNVDNTPPTTTLVVGGIVNTNVIASTGCATDGTGSGILSVTDVVYGKVLTLSAQGCWASTHYLYGGQPSTFPFIVKDKSGQCSTYNDDAYYGKVTLVSSGPC